MSAIDSSPVIEFFQNDAAVIIDSSITQKRPFRHNVWMKENEDTAAQLLVHHYYNTIQPALTAKNSINRNLEEKQEFNHPQEKEKIPSSTSSLLIDNKHHKHHCGIPKNIHFIWLGPNQIPSYPHFHSATAHIQETEEIEGRKINSSLHEESLRNQPKHEPKDNEHWKQQKIKGSGTIQSWIQHHPQQRGWDIQLWNEESIQAFHDNKQQEYGHDHHISNKRMTMIRDAYEHAIKIQNYGMASDIIRLELLYEYGGVYVDTDYYAFQCMDDLHQGSNVKFYCGASNTGCVELNNGLLGSVRGHPLIRDMIISISDWWMEVLSSPSKNILHNSKEKKKETIATTIGKGTKDESVLLGSLCSFLDEDSITSLQSAKISSKGKDVQNDHFTPMEVIEHTGPGLLTRHVLQLFLRNNNDNNNDDDNDDDKKELQLDKKEIVTCEEEGVRHLAVLPSVSFHALPNCHRSLVGVHHDDDSKQSRDVIRFQEVVDKCVENTVDGVRALHLWGCSWQK